MADVRLTLTTDSNQAVKGIQDTQKAAANLDKQMKDLFMANKKGFSDVEKIKAYEKQMDELKKKFAEVTTEQKKLISSQDQTSTAMGKTQKATSSLVSEIGKWALSFAAVGTALNLLKKAFQETEAGLRTFNAVGAVTKQILYDFVTYGKLSLANIALSLAANKKAEAQRIQQRTDLVDIAKAQKDYNELYFAASDRTLTDEARIQALNQAMLAHEVIIERKLKNAKEDLAVLNASIAARPEETKLLDARNAKEVEILEIEGEQFSQTKRLQSQLTGLKQEQIDKQINAQKKYQDMSLKLLDRYDKSQIDMLQGKAKLEAIRDFGLREIKELKDQLTKLGTITAEQDKIFEVLGMNVMKAFYEGMAKEIRISEDHIESMVTPAIIATITGTPDLIRKEVKKTQDEIDFMVSENEDFSIWKLLGIDTDSDEGGRQIAAIKELANTISGILEDSLDQRVEIAERERELLDTQISQLQNEIDLEAELMQEGYANNLDAKKKELEGLKKQREQALKEEEEALKRQRAFERISQAVSLASSVANILKEFTKLGPLGLGLAAVAIGALFTMWQAAKTKAAESTALAEGGSGSETGMITGRRHSQGGERFLDHVEVERGEAWGVLSAPASEKYGKVFHQMVSSFNKNEMPNIVSSPIIHNPVTVENSGPNSRLDKVIKINEALLKQSHQYNVGNKRIIRSGNKVRIVG